MNENGLLLDVMELADVVRIMVESEAISMANKEVELGELSTK
jgi:hypothetical protein